MVLEEVRLAVLGSRRDPRVGLILREVKVLELRVRNFKKNVKAGLLQEALRDLEEAKRSIERVEHTVKRGMTS